MKTSRWLAFMMLISLAALVASATLHAQSAPRKGAVKGRPTPVTASPDGGLGAPSTPSSDDTLGTAIDAQVQRMTLLASDAASLSTSFKELAALHKGADRSEILMMQRMSDAMGTVAGELKTSFQQYRRMLDDETATESGATKNDVQGLKGILDEMARQVDAAMMTLHSLQAQLGQG